MQHFVKRGTVAIPLLLTFVACNLAFAQTDETEVVERVEQAFARGDAGALLRHAADRVEVAVLGSSTLYSRAQATYVLEGFFREYPPVRFVADNPGSTRGNFIVAGRYWYGSDEGFLDVYLRFRWRDGACEVRELRIERPMR